MEDTCKAKEYADVHRNWPLFLLMGMFLIFTAAFAVSTQPRHVNENVTTSFTRLEEQVKSLKSEVVDLRAYIADEIVPKLNDD